MANLEYAVPISSNTIFNVASLAKQFTAFSIALLADKKLLSLNDDVHQYIPELPDYGEKITLLHLITHTSGLKDQWDLLNLAGWKPEDVITNKNVLDLILKQQELNFAPGEKFQYCNSGYTLLALVVERVTGKPFATWTQENLFGPLHMNHSFFSNNFAQIIPNGAHSYKATETGLEESVFTASAVGADGLHATLADLCKWVANYDQKIIGSDVVFDEVNGIPALEKSGNSNLNAAGRLKLSYGFGQGVKDYRGALRIGHDSADAGYRTYIGRFPQQHFAVILLGNSEAFEPEKTAMQIADIYLARQLSPPATEDAVAGKKLLIPETMEQTISGQYQLGDKRILRIFVVDRNIMGEIKSERRRFDLIPLTNLEYENKPKGIGVKYLKGNNEGTATIEFSESGKSITATKLVHLDLSYLDEYTGNFYCGALDAKYAIKVQDDHMVAILPRNNAVIITQNEADSFFGSHWWMRDIKFKRNKTNKITGFEINNGRAKKITFLKIGTK
ncbi:hypothetical protein BEN49_21405 [Hymenobacter coccineus]|uniref:Beta-lactamase-related domain-containing protein n=2 Tax=Hymenobacter coccineus TaxID=1908235 RepID=A0A1G1TJF9_9BACT|nr:hypothetical protein BEN49_21405 [Hymenobacter coccineus]